MKDFSDLVETETGEGPVICTITGDAGLGKTSLAATFPDVIFIRAENGFKAFTDWPEEKKPKGLPPLSCPQDLWDQLEWLIKGEHNYRTLVIDSVTQLEVMFADYVMKEDDSKPASLAQACGGYGAGYKAVAAMHGRVRQAAKILAERRGMHVVFIAHSDVYKMDPPDGDPYSRYELRLHDQSETFYKDDVDMIAYVRLETFTKGDKQTKVKKATSDGTRIAVCHASPSQVSKNRFGITEPVVLTKGVNPFPFIK